MREGDEMNDADRKLLPLLAGWLDGELTAEDAQRVEAALARSAELRAVLDEWRSVDQSLEGRTPSRSEADWEALARRVENAITADTNAVEPEPATGMQDRLVTMRDASPGLLERIRASLTTRGWVTGGSGAVAAIVLLVLLWPNRQDLLRDSGVVRDEPTPELDQETSAKDGGVDQTSGLAGNRPLADAADSDELQKDGRSLIGLQKPDSPAAPETRIDELLVDVHPPPAAALRQRQEGTPNVLERELEEVAIPSAVLVKPGDHKNEVQSEALESPKEDSGKREAAIAAPEPQFRLSAPERSSMSRQSSRNSTESVDSWLVRNEARLDEAVAKKEHDTLQTLIGDADRQRSTTPDGKKNAALLAFALRCRCEALRLSPTASKNRNACRKIRSDYESWQKLAERAARQSSEGARIDELVREVCP